MQIKSIPSYALNSGICIQRKMSNDRNKTLDRKATKILALEHSELAGPIQPLVKDGYKYVISFIDDYSGLIMLYMVVPVVIFVGNGHGNTSSNPGRD